MQIVLSTRNPSKAEQIRAVFLSSPITILTLDDIHVEGEAIEDGETLQQNALKKAVFAQQQLGNKFWIMAEDTGFFIDALDGEPGIKAARWAGANLTTEQITQYTLDRLKGAQTRAATFKATVAVLSPTGQQHFFSGSTRGHILEKPRCKPQPRMPYSPIFVPQESNLCWAEMSLEQENSISHRGKAFRKVRQFLEGAPQ